MREHCLARKRFGFSKFATAWMRGRQIVLIERGQTQKPQTAALRPLNVREKRISVDRKERSGCLPGAGWRRRGDRRGTGGLSGVVGICSA